jgi:hypothetical protein
VDGASSFSQECEFSEFSETQQLQESFGSCAARLLWNENEVRMYEPVLY